MIGKAAWQTPHAIPLLEKRRPPRLSTRRQASGKLHRNAMTMGSLRAMKTEGTCQLFVYFCISFFLVCLFISFQQNHNTEINFLHLQIMQFRAKCGISSPLRPEPLVWESSRIPPGNPPTGPRVMGCDGNVTLPPGKPMVSNHYRCPEPGPTYRAGHI